METIFIVIGTGAFIYGGAVLFHMGMTSFLWFWPLFGLVNYAMFAAAHVLRVRARRKEDIDAAPFVFFFTTYGLGTAVLLVLLSLIFYAAASARPQAGLDYMIVLGTQLDHNKVSYALKNRLDAAVDYYYQNHNTVFVLSGGRDAYDRSTESTVMYYYMVSKGVPAKNLRLEFYSSSTYEKLRFSQLLIEEEVRIDRRDDTAAFLLPDGEVIQAVVRPPSIGILTSDYNVFAAQRIAAKLGMDRAVAVGSASDPLLYPHLCVREAAMIFKDRVVGNL